MREFIWKIKKKKKKSKSQLEFKEYQIRTTYVMCSSSLTFKPRDIPHIVALPSKICYQPESMRKVNENCSI